MTTPARRDLATHSVENQPEPRDHRDLWASDLPLRTAAASADPSDMAKAGRRLGSAAMFTAGEDARRDAPRLVSFDRAGARLDEVHFSPAYHQIMAEALALGYAATPYDGGTHTAHAALVYMLSQVEPGICCPLTMTYAAVPALRADPALAATWAPKLTSRLYDPAIAPVETKHGATLGMAMTEKQGGSDVRANATRAERDGETYRLTGHKWFCSAPMSDGFLTLAQTDAGLTCFLVPRWLPEGRNPIHVMRLKAKLGNTANASSEIEYHGTTAYRLGAEGEGVKTIIEMVHHTRLDTAVAPAGLMRAALSEAMHWVSGRRTFQRRLIDQPLMRATLADIALDYEAATALAFAAANAFDGTTDEARAFARIAVALAKYLSNKRCPTVIAEAMEVLGGVGYTDDTPLPMLYREAPLNGIWEGSGNIICLDILRTLARSEASRAALTARLDAARGHSQAYDIALKTHLTRWPALPDEAEARWFAESLANLLATAILAQTAPEIAHAFASTRLGQPRGLTPGSLPAFDATAILDRLAPS